MLLPHDKYKSLTSKLSNVVSGKGNKTNKNPPPGIPHDSPNIDNSWDRQIELVKKKEEEEEEEEQEEQEEEQEQEQGARREEKGSRQQVNFASSSWKDLWQEI